MIVTAGARKAIDAINYYKVGRHNNILNASQILVLSHSIDYDKRRIYGQNIKIFENPI